MDATTVATLALLFALGAALYSSVGHGGASAYIAAMALFSIAPETMKPTALALNLLSSLATVVGGLVGYFALQLIQGLEATLLGIVAASMIYVAVADLIPGLHRRPELKDTASQALLIALGIGAIALVRAALPH